MKRILALFLVMMSIVLPSIAQNSQERSKLKVIELDLRAGTQKLKICEVRKNSELWKDLLTRVNTSNN